MGGVRGFGVVDEVSVRQGQKNGVVVGEYVGLCVVGGRSGHRGSVDPG
jgi:hypothetical protein